jgi:hypothetical protein
MQRKDERAHGDLFGDLFDDLEQQAEGLALVGRDAEVAEATRAEYARVDLAARLHACLGEGLLVGVTGLGTVDAVLRRVGDGWCLLGAGAQEWLVRLAAVDSVRGLTDRAVVPEARPLTGRLGLASALRGVSDARADVVLHLLDGSVLRGSLARVGADFVDVRTGEGRSGYVDTLPFGAIAAVRLT